jgi:DNA topoisomerase-1
MWRTMRDTVKFDRMVAFGVALPRIRRAVEDALALPGLPRERVIAIVVRLLDETAIRVGNDEYARDNGSFGLTTLRSRHARVDGRGLCLEFRGKSGRRHRVPLRDQRLIRLVKRCRDLPGYHLFQFVDEHGQRGSVHSDDVNEFLRQASGGDFTAKDFRTWSGTVLAATALAEMPAAGTEPDRRRRVAEAITVVSERLRNTPAVCRASYVHPVVIDAYARGELTARSGKRDSGPPGLSPTERWVLRLLKRHQDGSSLPPARAA